MLPNYYESLQVCLSYYLGIGRNDKQFLCNKNQQKTLLVKYDQASRRFSKVGIFAFLMKIPTRISIRYISFIPKNQTSAVWNEFSLKFASLAWWWDIGEAVTFLFLDYHLNGWVFLGLVEWNVWSIAAESVPEVFCQS